jgi:hypothetical protein
MRLAHQTHGVRDSEPKPRRSGPTPAALNDNVPAGRTCPVCGAWAPMMPVASDYLGGGQIRHHWVCDPCGHAWTTAVRMLS